MNLSVTPVTNKIVSISSVIERLDHPTQLVRGEQNKSGHFQSLPRAWLVDPYQPQAPIPVLESLSLGRAFDNDFVLLHDTVSEHHCRIERKDESFLLTSTDSLCRTFVNNTCVLCAVLRSGDEIQLGSRSFYWSDDSQWLDKKAFFLTTKSQKWQRQLDLLRSVSRTHLPILLLGPSGTGKEIVAEAVHRASVRSGGPLVKVNCSALTDSLIESELFGHVKGSFTGASSDRKGAFESARKGTLFLDEIGELPLAAQAKLLRALENREIRPVGSDRTLRTDVRIIAATHPNLLQKVKDGKFREDLYFRLNVVNIATPKLTDRLEDFDDLVQSFAKEYKVKLAPGSVDTLKLYSWPGNIRELKNFIARMSALHPYRLVSAQQVQDLLAELADGVLSETHHQVPSKKFERPAPPPALPMLKQLEKQLIIRHLTENRGNQRKTATQMGLPKSTLFDRIRFYQIDPRIYEVT